MVLGLGSGIFLAVADHFIEPMMPKPRTPLSAPPAWTGLLASVGAGIQEEIWLRLGIMTTLVWLETGARDDEAGRSIRPQAGEFRQTERGVNQAEGRRGLAAQ